MPRADVAPQDILPRHRRIMRMQLSGFTNADIADTLGMDHSSISYIINSDIYKAEFQKLQDRADEKAVGEQIDVKKKLETMSGFAVEKLDQMLKDPKTADKLRADMIFDVLDRTGNSAPKKTEVLVDYVTALESAFKERRRRAQVRASASAPPSPLGDSAQISHSSPSESEADSITVEVENLPAVVGE